MPVEHTYTCHRACGSGIVFRANRQHDKGQGSIIGTEKVCQRQDSMINVDELLRITNASCYMGSHKMKGVKLML